MLGIPYEGRMPDFTAQPARPDQQPTSPGAVAGRAVRQEQDFAYQQSLQVTIFYKLQALCVREREESA